MDSTKAVKANNQHISLVLYMILRSRILKTVSRNNNIIIDAVKKYHLGSRPLKISLSTGIQ